MNKSAAKLAGEWWAARLGPAHENKRKALAAAVEKIVKRELKNINRVRLENDYDPNPLLLEAVLAVGIECKGFMFSGDGIFPRKHALTVSREKLEPKEGYGNWTADIIVRGK